MLNYYEEIIDYKDNNNRNEPKAPVANWKEKYCPKKLTPPIESSSTLTFQSDDPNLSPLAKCFVYFDKTQGINSPSRTLFHCFAETMLQADEKFRAHLKYSPINAKICVTVHAITKKQPITKSSSDSVQDYYKDEGGEG